MKRPMVVLVKLQSGLMTVMSILMQIQEKQSIIKNFTTRNIYYEDRYYVWFQYRGMDSNNPVHSSDDFFIDQYENYKTENMNELRFVIDTTGKPLAKTYQLMGIFAV